MGNKDNIVLGNWVTMEVDGKPVGYTTGGFKLKREPGCILISTNLIEFTEENMFKFFAAPHETLYNVVLIVDHGNTQKGFSFYGCELKCLGKSISIERDCEAIIPVTFKCSIQGKRE